MSQNSSEMLEMEPSPNAAEEQVADPADISDEQLNIPNAVEEPVFELFDSDYEDYQRRCALLEAIVNAPTREAKRRAEKEGCEEYHKDKAISKKQLGRYIKKYLRKEFHLLSPGRKDKGQFRKDKQWYDFSVKFYLWGQRDGAAQVLYEILGAADYSEGSYTIRLD